MIVLTSNKSTQFHRGKVLWAARTANSEYGHVDILKPSAELLRLLSNDVIDRARFVQHYEIEARMRLARIHEWMDKLRANRDYTLLCYCDSHARLAGQCHLSVVAKLILEHRPDLMVMMDGGVKLEREVHAWWVNY